MDELQAVRLVFEEGWNRENFDDVQAVLAEEFRFHVGGRTRTMGIGDLRDVVRRWHGAFPDFAFDIHAAVASGDRAAVHATLRGTHMGAWGEIAPTGRSVRVEHMFFFRFADGRIVEVWELLDGADLRRQLTDG